MAKKLPYKVIEKTITGEVRQYNGSLGYQTYSADGKWLGFWVKLEIARQFLPLK